MTWKSIISALWDKLFGSSDRSKEFGQIIKGYKELYHEQAAIVEKYKAQTKTIQGYRHKHPGNGEELDKWQRREYELMLQLIAAKKEIAFYKERCIFLEHDNEYLLGRNEKVRDENEPDELASD